MSQSESPKSFVSGEALERFRFVKPSAGKVVYADKADLGIGVTQQKVADATAVAVRMTNQGGTMMVTAAGAAAVDEYAYHADDGKVSNVPNGPRIGKFLEAAAADGDIVEIAYQLTKMEWFGRTFETLADNKTVDIQDVGKVFVVTVDAKVVTLAAIAAGLGPMWFVNGGAAAAVAVNLSPNANDKIMGADVAGTDNKDQINTKATAKRGDYMCLDYGNADGYKIVDKEGIWAEEAAG
jgi:hypothetical protein